MNNKINWIKMENKKTKNKINEKIILLFSIIIISLILLFPTLSFSVNAEEEIIPVQEETPTVNPETSSPACAAFDGAIINSITADLAIECNQPLTDEQFLLASPAMQEKYVLTSQYANFLNEPQRNLFINTILKDEVKINDNKANVLKFLRDNTDYSISDPTTNKTLKQVFEKTANESADTIKILNEEKSGENRILFQKYFNEFTSVIYVNSDFEGYDSKTKIFTTKGDMKSKFTTDDLLYFQLSGFSNFFIGEDGRLSAKNYNGVEICTDCNYYISSDGKKITVLNGKLNLNGNSFTSDNAYEVFVDKGQYTVSGNKVVGMKGEDKLFEVDGTVTVLTEDHYVLGKNTNYVQYQKNQPIFNMATEEKTDLFTTNDPIKINVFDYGLISPEGEGDITFESEETTAYAPCKDFKTSCVYWNPATNKVDVNLVDNTLTFNDDKKVISYLDVAQIHGKDSSFVYNTQNGTLTFTDSAVNERGNHELFPGYTAVITENGEQYEIISGSSSISTCASPCTDSGVIKKKKGDAPAPKINLPDKPTNKVDAILVITANPFEGQNKLNASEPKTIKGLYVWQTVEEGIAQSIKSKLIPIFTTNEKYTPLKTAADKYIWTPDSKTKTYYKLNEAKQINESQYKNMVVIITGHHGPGRGIEFIYSDHWYFKDELGANDLKLFGSASDSTEIYNQPTNTLYDLKPNDNVYVVMFSACQTVKMPYSLQYGTYKINAVYPRKLIKSLTNTYPNLRLIIGYDNIAPAIDLIYNTNLDRGVAPDFNLLNNPKDTGLINFDILENGGFEAFGDKATDIYKVDLEGLAAYRKAHPEEDDPYADRYWNGKRIAYYYKAKDGNWYFHTNYIYDKKTDTWSRNVNNISYKINLTEMVGLPSPETKEILDKLNS
jgi:hypothetical protein